MTINRHPYEKRTDGTVAGVFTLTSSESKRLIGKAVSNHPLVKKALKSGKVVLTHGTTTSYAVEEILGQAIDRQKYVAGYIDGGFKVTRSSDRLQAYVLVNGKVADLTLQQALAEFSADDVLVKSANAVDPEGNVGILMTDPAAGTIGRALPMIVASGGIILSPVGLEKLIPSVREACYRCGQKRLKYTLDKTVALMPLMNAVVVTELEALQILTGVEATHVASGGINGSEGAVTIVVEGTEAQVKDALDLVKRLKGEPPIRMIEQG